MVGDWFKEDALSMRRHVVVLARQKLRWMATRLRWINESNKLIEWTAAMERLVGLVDKLEKETFGELHFGGDPPAGKMDIDDKAANDVAVGQRELMPILKSPVMLKKRALKKSVSSNFRRSTQRLVSGRKEIKDRVATRGIKPFFMKKKSQTGNQRAETKDEIMVDVVIDNKDAGQSKAEQTKADFIGSLEKDVQKAEEDERNDRNAWEKRKKLKNAYKEALWRSLKAQKKDQDYWKDDKKLMELIVEVGKDKQLIASVKGFLSHNVVVEAMKLISTKELKMYLCEELRNFYLLSV